MMYAAKVQHNVADPTLQSFVPACPNSHRLRRCSSYWAFLVFSAVANMRWKELARRSG